MTLVTCYSIVFFFFNDTATTEIYTLSLHDALPISLRAADQPVERGGLQGQEVRHLERLGDLGERDAQRRAGDLDRKSTRLNSSHANISYAVFCLKKKKRKTHIHCCLSRT